MMDSRRRSAGPGWSGIGAISGAMLLLAVAAGCMRPSAGPSPTRPEVILATTTSTQDSGLLDVLVPLFEQRTGYRVKPIAVGTGQALALGARGEADVVLVHAPEAEERWMAEGNGAERLLVMHNDFVILGPSADPAGLRGANSAVEALRQIAERHGTWVSRDDNSGTDQLEQQLWRQAGLNPGGQAWRLTTGQGMGATLTLADQKQGYLLSDRGTYLARKQSLDLTIAVEGDPRLLNVYHVIPVNPQKLPQVNAEGGKAFAQFMVAAEAQRLIGEFGADKYGQPLFVPDAGKAERDLGR